MNERDKMREALTEARSAMKRADEKLPENAGCGVSHSILYDARYAIDVALAVDAADKDNEKRLFGPLAETPDSELRDFGDHPDYPLAADKDNGEPERALETAIRHTRQRYVPGTPERYPKTMLVGLTVLEAEALLAALAVPAPTDTLAEAHETLDAVRGNVYLHRIAELTAEATIAGIEAALDASVAPVHKNTFAEVLREIRKRLWWFIEQDHGDGNEIEASDVAARAIQLQDDIDAALASVRVGSGDRPPISAEEEELARLEAYDDYVLADDDPVGSGDQGREET